MQDNLSRRKLLSGIGAAGVTSFAGCSGQENNKSSNENGGGSPIDPIYNTGGLVKVPANLQFNPFNSTTWSFNLEKYIYEPLGKYDPADDEYIPVLATDWSVNDSSATVKLSDKYSWHNGDQVTAEDVVTRLKLDVFNSLWDFTSEITASDDQTVDFKLTESVNKKIFESLVLSTNLTTPKHEFNSWRKKIEKASTKKEKEQVYSNLQKWTLKKATGNGPFKVKKKSQSKLEAVPHKKHPASDSINFEKFVMSYSKGDSGKQQALLSDKADAMRVFGAPQNVVKQLPEHFRLYFINNYAGRAIYFNQKNKHLQKRKVRQAIAHLLNRKQITGNIPSPEDQYIPIETPSNIGGEGTGNIKKWLSGVSESFNQYETNKEKAASLLNQAGFNKQGNKWVDSSGDSVSVTLKGPTGWTDDDTILQTAAARLNEFGITAEYSTVEQTAYFGKTFPNGNYDIGTGWWGSLGKVHPYFAMSTVLGENGDFHTSAGYPFKVKVPMPIGEGSNTKTIDIRKKIQKIPTSTKPEKTRKLVQELAWYVNQDVPFLPICEKTDMGVVSTDDWNIPPKGDPAMKIASPATWLVRVGKLTAKTK